MSMKMYIKNDKIIIIDIAVIDYMNEGFELTDKAGNHIESEKGYRCVLSVADGEVVYKD